ncbi:mycothiol acetyltransferase [Actinoplanes sp. NBRC 14428]|uniref:Mycothiol acetyltransferase n=1 Tax=Pseudosporangium ferrugineum TaxID=439699 RepID=A0A2T0S5T7_9ACTN|nr:mycothiol synthase [Pseudosporangium ferrugineum]PRY28779.1 mycothiol synthase [Pseudosporangium ferrugineum]BCJ53759.1 mycothiol acetyltransferase [Actinoplanes sp. NBRC 14428]
MTDVRSTDWLTPAEAAGVQALAVAADEADGVSPLSEDGLLGLRGTTHRHLLSYADTGELAGYAYLSGTAGELVVHPKHRLRGHGTALIAATGPGERLFWAHGDEPSARAFAEKLGFARTRVLWQMRRPLADLPDVPLPDGVRVRAFEPGADDEAWLGVNSRAFAHHPEQGRWTREDLRLRFAEPWFDPAGFLLAVDPADGHLLGFHWTKIHPAEGADPAIGEIYVLGVDPGGHRRGLGAALSVAGLRHLAAQGLSHALLYVDESNTAAVALYRRLGFEIHSTDVQYHRPA